jgi:hypothetical protein
VEKVSYKADIDSQIAKVREHGYKKTKKIPPGLKRNENKYFVKSFSGVLNVYAIIDKYGILFNHFELQKNPFQKMIKELEAVTELYKKYNKRVRPHFKKYEGKTIGRVELQKIFGLTKKNKKLMEKAGAKRLAFLRKYSDFYSFCVRYTVAPDGVFLHVFRVGQAMKKSDRSLLFKFFDAVLENYGVYVETAGRPEGSGVRYTTEVIERARNRYPEREKDCRVILAMLRKNPFPYTADELAREYRLPPDLLRKVTEGLRREGPSFTLRKLTLSALHWDEFGKVETRPEYLRKLLQRRKSHSQSY